MICWASWTNQLWFFYICFLSIKFLFYYYFFSFVIYLLPNYVLHIILIFYLKVRCGIILPRCWLGFFSFLDKQCVEHHIKILKTFINFNVQGLRYFCGEQNNKPTASTQVLYRTTDNRRFWRAKRRMQWKGKYFLSGPNQSTWPKISLSRQFARSILFSTKLLN